MTVQQQWQPYFCTRPTGPGRGLPFTIWDPHTHAEPQPQQVSLPFYKSGGGAWRGRPNIYSVLLDKNLSRPHSTLGRGNQHLHFTDEKPED